MTSRVARALPRAEPDAPPPDGSPAHLVVAVAAGMLCLTAIVEQAWLSDDAVISLRAVANTLAGNGATFNVLERVQVYTHPLWFGVLLLTNQVLHDPIVTAIGVGVVFAVGYLGVLVRACWGRSRPLTAALLVVLAGSPAFVEWSTSGLENSLAYLLFAVLLGVVAPRVGLNGGIGASVTLGVVASAIVLTRLDLAVVAGPIVLGVLWRRRSLHHLMASAIAGVVPLAAWFAFAVSYYGFALPNTAYAKLNLDIPSSELALRGVNYLRVSAARQPLSLLLLVVAISLLVVEARRGRRDRAGIALGLLFYLGYVISLGGDFMEGRFLAVPVAIAALVLATSSLATSSLATSGAARDRSAPSVALAALLVGAAVVSAIGPVSTPWLQSTARGMEWHHDEDGYAGVADERGFYLSQGMGFWALMDRHTDDEATHIRELRDALRRWDRVTPDEVRRVEVRCGGLGRYGVLLGPRVHLVDPCGLADPTLARMTFTASDFAWRSGHYEREVPEGYLDAVLTGDATGIQDPEVRAIFEEVTARVR